MRRPLPKFRREPRGDAAGDPQPPPGRLWRRPGRVRGAVPLRRWGSIPTCARPTSSTAARTVVGPGPGHGRAARLPQRPGPPSSLRPGPSACRWTVIPPGSSPTSPWSSSRSWPAAVTSRSPISRWPRRCENLGYTEQQIEDIIRLHRRHQFDLDGAPHINRESLMRQGLHRRRHGQDRGGACRRCSSCGTPSTCSSSARRRCSASDSTSTSTPPSSSTCSGRSGSPVDEIWEANDQVCGRQTIEGAPHLKDEHLAVFDTANKNGRQRPAVHPSHRPHQDDGGRPAVHLGCRLARRSTCPTRPPSRTSRRAT